MVKLAMVAAHVVRGILQAEDGSTWVLVQLVDGNPLPYATVRLDAPHPLQMDAARPYCDEQYHGSAREGQAELIRRAGWWR